MVQIVEVIDEVNQEDEMKHLLIENIKLAWGCFVNALIFYNESLDVFWYEQANQFRQVWTSHVGELLDMERGPDFRSENEIMARLFTIIGVNNLF